MARWVWLLLLLLSVCGCGAGAPAVHLSASWADGQTTSYDALDDSGHVTGTASFTWQRDGTGWKSVFALHGRGKSQHSDIQMDAALRPRSSLRVAGSTRTRADYGARTITIDKTVKGKTTTKRLGRVFVLRSYRLRAGAPLQGDPSKPHIAPPKPLRVSWSIVALTLLVQLPLMIALPLLLGWQLHKRAGASYALWAFGAITFIASQLVHLPLNWALGMLGTPRALGLWPLPALALAAGLSAGLCEELARYVTVRLLLRRRALGFVEGMQLGAGHGGIEAMILGFLSALALLIMLVIVWFPGLAAHLGAPPGTLRDAARGFWSMAWSGPLVGGLERVSALAAHIGLNVLVVRAGARRQLGWLGAAIAAHAAMDAYAVWAAHTLGIAWTELGVAALAALILASAFAMRRSVGATT